MKTFKRIGKKAWNAYKEMTIATYGRYAEFYCPSL